MLEEANIPYKDFRYMGMQKGYQVILNDNIDAVQHSFSYGNTSDLLEIMGGLTKEEYEVDTILGCLTAEEVFKRFKYCYENNTMFYKE